MPASLKTGGPTASRRHARILGATVACAVALGALVWHERGGGPAQQYFAGYLIELSLSADNLFVFILVFEHFRIAPADQGRALLWGFLGATVLRTVFILAGAGLLARFHWLLYAFGLLIAGTGLRLALTAAPRTGSTARSVPAAGAVERLLGRLLPVSATNSGPRFTVVEGGRRMATRLLAALVVLEFADLLFAFDSVPAVLAVTRDGFIAVAANLAAVASLRSLYSVLTQAIHRFRHLRVAMAVILLFVGGKMLAEPWWPIPPSLSLGIIGAVLGFAALASIRDSGPVS